MRLMDTLRLKALSLLGVKFKRSGFAGASMTRLTASLSQWSGAINADLDGQLVILRSRARQLCANNEYGRRFLSLVASNMVGPRGPTLQVRAYKTGGSEGELDKVANDIIEIAWAKFCRTADIGGRMHLSQMLKVIVKSVARDGEALVRMVRRRDLPFGMALQLLEADRIDEAINGTANNGNRIRMGVEIDATLRPVAVYITTVHPGENYQGMAKKVERVELKDIFHLFLPERAEQVRGYTWLHAVLIRANNLHAYEEAAIVAARVGASKVGVWTSKDGNPDALANIAAGKDTDGNLVMTAEPGEFMKAPPGYELSNWDPDYPHANFESFVGMCIRGFAMGLDVATHNLSGNMTEVNYSSARIAELSEREIWMGLQEWLIESFMIPLYREWLALALLRGDIVFPSGKALPAERLQKFVDASRFQGKRWDWVDPLKEAEAATVLIDAGLASRTEIAAAKGREFDDIADELKLEKATLEKAGLTSQLAPKSPKPKPAETAQ